MKTSVYKSYDDLPLFLNVETVAQILGVSISSVYELLHEPGFRWSGSGAAWWCQKKSSWPGYPPRRKEVHKIETTSHETGCQRAQIFSAQ